MQQKMKVVEGGRRAKGGRGGEEGEREGAAKRQLRIISKSIALLPSRQFQIPAHPLTSCVTFKAP